MTPVLAVAAKNTKSAVANNNDNYRKTQIEL